MKLARNHPLLSGLAAALGMVALGCDTLSATALGLLGIAAWWTWDLFTLKPPPARVEPVEVDDYRANLDALKASQAMTADELSQAFRAHMRRST